MLELSNNSIWALYKQIEEKKTSELIKKPLTVLLTLYP